MQVKEQLSNSNLTQPRERLIDSKTMLPLRGSSSKTAAAVAVAAASDATPSISSLPWLCPGARRSFFCRMKTKPSLTLKEEVDHQVRPI